MAQKKKRPTKAEWESKELLREIKLEVRQKIKKQNDALYNSVSRKTRQEFIRLCREQGGNIAGLGKQAGIEDAKAAVHIWLSNHKKITHQVLKKPEEVK